MCPTMTSHFVDPKQNQSHLLEMGKKPHCWNLVTKPRQCGFFSTSNMAVDVA